MPKQQFEDTLKLTKLALLLSGIKVYRTKWNHILERFINQYLYYTNFIILYAVIFGEVYWVIDGIQTGKSFVELSLTSPCITISVLGTIKSIKIYFNRNIIVNVIDELRDLHPVTVKDDTGAKKGTEKRNKNDEDFPDTETEIKNKIAKECMKFLKMVIFLLWGISAVVLIMFCFSPLLAMGYDHYVMGVFTVKYPYLVKYFFDAYNMSWWELMYFLQVWATTIVCVNIFGCDTLFYVLCSYIAMNFRLLGVEFENIISNSLDETKEKLKAAVIRHQVLINLVDRTQFLYSKSMLFNIVISSLLICLSAFNITVAEDYRIIIAFITFLTMCLSQISLVCLFGDMLMRSSMQVSESIYKCRWYKVDNYTKKTILIALMRAQKPCKLSAANFADLNLGAFTTVLSEEYGNSLVTTERGNDHEFIKILSRSWSYFALLKTVYN